MPSMTMEPTTKGRVHACDVSGQQASDQQSHQHRFFESVADYKMKTKNWKWIRWRIRHDHALGN